MALTIHGSARSRTMRVLWMTTELGLDFEHDPIVFDDPRLKSAAFLALNPAGAIPTIDDDGFALAESLAINLYLAKKHDLGGLYPTTLEGEAQAWRWSLWLRASWSRGSCATSCWPTSAPPSPLTPGGPPPPRWRRLSGR
jgi:glutathione S-transferase